MNSITKIALVLAFIIGTASIADAATDYCDKALCRRGTHIACGHNNRFAKSCPPDARLVDITPSLSRHIVAQFNEKRNLIAGGGIHNHKPACRMGTMQWDKELAKLAELNVKQCKMDHDSCHNTKSYHMSGQNLAWMTYYNTPNDADQLTTAVRIWFDEVKHSSMKIIDKYPKIYSGPPIGHFTAMMSERNIRVGCAAATYSEKGEDYKSYLVACNMAYTNMIGIPIYTSCDIPASKCVRGKNLKFPNLCTTSEKYNVNGY